MGGQRWLVGGLVVAVVGSGLWWLQSRDPSVEPKRPVDSAVADDGSVYLADPPGHHVRSVDGTVRPAVELGFGFQPRVVAIGGQDRQLVVLRGHLEERVDPRDWVYGVNPRGSGDPARLVDH